MNGQRGLWARGHRTPEDLKSASEPLVPFRAEIHSCGVTFEFRGRQMVAWIGGSEASDGRESLRRVPGVPDRDALPKTLR